MIASAAEVLHHRRRQRREQRPWAQRRVGVLRDRDAGLEPPERDARGEDERDHEDPCRSARRERRARRQHRVRRARCSSVDTYLDERIESST
jgi:hypothetical protein